MVIKISNKMVGENAKEQFELEKKRFRLKEQRKENEIEKKRQDLIEMGIGNRKLFEFENKDKYLKPN